jgi:hypothetical protein
MGEGVIVRLLPYTVPRGFGIIGQVVKGAQEMGPPI